MRCPALFLLANAVLSGCICDSPEDGAVVLQYSRLFEAGRRAEYEGNIRIAEDTYRWLIRCDSCCGEYGLAMLQLRREPDSQDAVKHLIACAKRSSYTSLFMDSVMDSAFSAAAMAKLSDIARSRHERPDVAAALRCMMSNLVTPQVRAWSENLKANADSAAIYRDVISAVETCGRGREREKELKWSEICEVFLMKGVTE